MPEYRDIGYIGNRASQPVLVNDNQITQVYLATHEGVDKYLPLMQRSFISFSWGGKNIEDFGFLVTTDGSFLQKKIYGNFTDNITESNILDGQIYWNTHYDSNDINFSLSTDGITEAQFNEFKHYFQPGIIKELVLAENPNRAINVRLSETPELHMIPFEKKIIKKIVGQEYETSTTLYKGSIFLSFIADEPFWYSKVNVLDYKNSAGKYEQGKWINTNGEKVDILQDQDALKIIMEDNIPILDMILNTSEEGTVTSFSDLISFGTKEFIGSSNIKTSESSKIGYAIVGKGHVYPAILNYSEGIEISPPSIISTDDSATDSVSSAAYVYYPGTAPCKPVLYFTITPTINETSGYITIPYNSFGTNSKEYNTIVFQSQQKKKLKFTLPNFYMSYNQVIQIFNNIKENMTWEQIKTLIRDNIKHWIVRNYAIRIVSFISIIQDYQDITWLNKTAIKNRCIEEMIKFLIPTEEVKLSADYIIDCNAGQATAFISCIKEYGGNKQIIEENVGDMICSEYLTLEDMNVLANDGMLKTWTLSHPEYCYRIYSDIELKNFNVSYKYLYL